jgi:lipopolysaccharide/colanic/teichoic acid biosynthesis glycosyltransferase/GT2 family glycosyltransferase
MVVIDPQLEPFVLAPTGEAEVEHAPAGLTADVVLITKSSCTDLARSLASIRAAAEWAGAGLLIIDLGSTDGTQAFVSNHAPGARAVWLDTTDELSDAIDVAIASSQSDVLVLMSPTLEPRSPDAVSSLIRHLDEHPHAAVAAPAVIGHSGDVLPTAGAVPHAAALLSTRGEAEAAWARRKSARAHDCNDLPGGCDRVQWARCEALAVRRTELMAVGGLDSRFSGSLAALDLSIRLRRRGHEIHYLHHAQMSDAGGRMEASVRRAPRQSIASELKFLARHLRHGLGASSDSRILEAIRRAARRTFDVVAAAILLVLLSPVLAIVAAVVRLDSSGPAIFRQRRVGRGGRTFEMYKFRTMSANADPAPHEQFVRDMILGGSQAGDPAGEQEARIFKVHPDPRVTRIGRLLRRASLDELPQLYNVLRGDMTLVGFRPPIPYEVANYPRWYYRRFDGLPGLTGLWQVSGRNEKTYEEMVRLDVEYLNRRTFRLDLVLLVRTIRVLVSGRGAY